MRDFHILLDFSTYIIDPHTRVPLYQNLIEKPMILNTVTKIFNPLQFHRFLMIS